MARPIKYHQETPAHIVKQVHNLQKDAATVRDELNRTLGRSNYIYLRFSTIYEKLTDLTNTFKRLTQGAR